MSKGVQKPTLDQMKVITRLLEIIKGCLKLNSEFPSSHNSAEPTINYLIYRVYNMKTNQQLRKYISGREI